MIKAQQGGKRTMSIKESKHRYYEKHKNKYSKDGVYRVNARMNKIYAMSGEDIEKELEVINKRQLRDAERKALLLAEISRRAEEAAKGEA